MCKVTILEIRRRNGRALSHTQPQQQHIRVCIPCDDSGPPQIICPSASTVVDYESNRIHSISTTRPRKGKALNDDIPFRSCMKMLLVKPLVRCCEVSLLPSSISVCFECLVMCDDDGSCLSCCCAWTAVDGYSEKMKRKEEIVRSLTVRIVYIHS
jgi:hypothetical protein